MSIYIPYTYLIGWSKLNTWYYGSRFALKSNCLYETGCHPDDLFVTYFTSSKYVKNFIKLNGNPDIIQIRKTFPSNNKNIFKEVIKHSTFNKYQSFNEFY